MSDKTLNLDTLLAEIAHLKEAEALLEQIWMELGPYFDGEIDNKTRSRLQAFFNFDDSE